MEKFKDLYGLYVECGEGQNEQYALLKDNLERTLRDALQKVKLADHKGFDVGFILFNNMKSILSCCVDNVSLWIGLYDKATKSIQRYVVFDDIKSLTDADIKRFVDVIENITKNPELLANVKNLKEAWEKEVKIIENELSEERDDPVL